MKRLSTSFILIMFLFSAILHAETKILSGALSGKIEGTINVSDNLTKELNGKISGEWSAKIYDDGSLSGEANGSFGSLGDNDSYGLSGTFNVKYDPKSKKLIGTWNLPGLNDNNTIEFSVNEFTGKFEGPVEGKIPTKDGGLEFNGKIILDFTSLPLEMSGSVDTGLNIKVGWRVLNFQAGTCQEGYVTDKNGIVKGKWNVNIDPDQNITGNANGVFQGIAKLSLNITSSCISNGLSQLISMGSLLNISIPPLTLNFPYYGTWMGTLQGNMEQGLYFGGSWTESYDEIFYNSMGTGFENIDIGKYKPLDSSKKFGGSVKINIDVSNASPTIIPITGTIEGGGSANVHLKDLARQQGICTKYSSVLSLAPKEMLPECVKNGDICDCLPDYVTVEWWLEETSLKGNLGFNK